jgi:ATP-dependent RNA helicase RhlE
VLIFTRTKHGADKLTKHLIASVINAAAIHGGKSQNSRVQALDDFKAGRIRVLVATDIAARGIDISQLPHVMNYELPNVAADYVHRIGRTGRAGQEGEAVSLVCDEERAFFQDIEKLIGQSIELEIRKGYAPKVWSTRMPTTHEVQKARDTRRIEMLKERGPRPPRGSLEKRPSKRKFTGGGRNRSTAKRPPNRKD